MPSSLTVEEIDQLTSLLGGLARLAAQTPQLSDAQLDTLLLGADLESSIAVQQEFKRWSKLLANLRMQPIELYDSVLEALKMRGIPEASARLAAKVVVDGRSNSTGVLAKPLTVSVKFLDFGAVPADQVAVAEFTVEGGPGHIVVESDHLTVAPTKFGAGITQIRVEARSRSAAGLWTKLKLMTASDSVEIQVVAQWETMPDIAGSPDAFKRKGRARRRRYRGREG